MAMVNFRVKTISMRHLIILLLAGSLFFVGCNSKEKKENITNESDLAETKIDAPSPKVDFPIYDYQGLEPLLNKEDDKTYIVNFWATWCKPCIAELPYFERTYAEQKANGVELILVNLDMPSMWEKRLVPFVKKKELKGQVVILDDPNMNDWIPKIDEDWGGGIPATLIYNKEKRAFFEREFTYDELNEELQHFIN